MGGRAGKAAALEGNAKTFEIAKRANARSGLERAALWAHGVL